MAPPSCPPVQHPESTEVSELQVHLSPLYLFSQWGSCGFCLFVCFIFNILTSLYIYIIYKLYILYLKLLMYNWTHCGCSTHIGVLFCLVLDKSVVSVQSQPNNSNNNNTAVATKPLIKHNESTIPCQFACQSSNKVYLIDISHSTAPTNYLCYLYNQQIRTPGP